MFCLYFVPYFMGRYLVPPLTAPRSSCFFTKGAASSIRFYDYPPVNTVVADTGSGAVQFSAIWLLGSGSNGRCPGRCVCVCVPTPRCLRRRGDPRDTQKQVSMTPGEEAIMCNTWHMLPEVAFLLMRTARLRCVRSAWAARLP